MLTQSGRRGRFVTLENFILDTFTRIDDDGTERPIDRPDEIGGAGTYSIIGARIFSAPSTLGMIVDYTPETMPEHITAKLEHYGRDAFVFRPRTDGQPTIRAVNRYRGQLRIFEYLTAPLYLTPESLRGTPLEDPLPSIIHFIPMADRMVQIVREVQEMRDRAGSGDWDPWLVWEPDIPACVPECLEAIRSITPQTHIISPNHSEALSLLSRPPVSGQPDPATRAALQKACVGIAALGPKVAAIIRCGPLGCCYVDTRATASPREEDVLWVPAYWDPSLPGSSARVVDPTGAGNSFMGGLGAALNAGEDLHEAVLWGTVASSFVIEQDGLPVLTEQEGVDRWNGEDPRERVRLLRERVRLLRERMRG